MIIKTVFSFFWKIITFKKGSALIFSSILSSIFMLTANPIFDTLLKNTEFKNLVVPIVVQISGFTVFFLFVILDFVTGISFAIYEARKKGKKNYFETERLYRTIWKMLGVLLLATLVALLVLLDRFFGRNVPRQVGHVNHAVDVARQTDEQTEFGDVLEIGRAHV